MGTQQVLMIVICVIVVAAAIGVGIAMFNQRVSPIPPSPLLHLLSVSAAVPEPRSGASAEIGM